MMKHERDGVLIVPPVIDSPQLPMRDGDYAEENLGVASLAAYLRSHGLRVAILDCGLEHLSVEEAATTIQCMRPRWAGVAVQFLSAHLLGAIALARAIRDTGFTAPLLAGGHTATLLAEPLLTQAPEIDAVVLGEGEETMLDVASRLAAGDRWQDADGLAYRDGDGTMRANRPRALIAELDRLPFAARDYITSTYSYRLGTASITSSRGCPFDCSFCSVGTFFGRNAGGRRWRGRSPEHIVDEIEEIAGRYGIHHFSFPDDNFLGFGRRDQEDRIARFGEELRRRRLEIRFAITLRADSVWEEPLRDLKALGLNTVFIGIESGSQAALDRFNKKITVERNREALAVLRTLGLRCTASYITFDPDTRFSEIDETIRFVRETVWPGMGMNPTAFYNSLMPYPGTPARRELERRGMLMDIPVDCGAGRWLRGVFLHMKCRDYRVGLLLELMQRWGGVVMERRKTIDGFLKELNLAWVAATDVQLPQEIREEMRRELRPWIGRVNGWQERVLELTLGALELLCTEVRGAGPLDLTADTGDALLQRCERLLDAFERTIWGTDPGEAARQLEACVQQVRAACAGTIHVREAS